MLALRVTDDIRECERLWRSFAPSAHLFDDWDYRACFYDPSVHRLHFIVGEEGGREVGIWPLWKRMGETHYEWFGGEFPEHNRILVREPRLIPGFIAGLPDEVWLPYLEMEYARYFSGRETEASFYIDLVKHPTIEDYLALFSKKHRKNLLRDLRILSEGRRVEVARNDLCDFDLMARLNQSRFPEDSFFADPVFINGLRRLVELALRRGELEMLSIRIDGTTQAAEAAVLHNGEYTVLLGGSNLEVANIGKLLTIEHMKNALSRGARIIDFLAHDCGWKRLWNMEEVKWCEIALPQSMPHDREKIGPE